MSTGKWRDPGVPHRGWTHHGCEDTGEISTTCEMCEKETIRHVHYVTHADYPGELRVGCICAEKLTEDYVGPREAEGTVKKRRSRLSTFMTRGWKEGRFGSSHRDWKGRRVLIAPRSSGWIAKVDGEGGRKVFVSQEAARLAVSAARLWLTKSAYRP
jgi:hypothetical protein